MAADKTIEIRSRWDAVLYVAKGAADVGAAVEEAAREGADLRGAYLQRADLRGAYLRGADLRGAYLQRAYLQGAKGINPYLTNDLLWLKDQVGKIRAYKLVTPEGYGPFQGGLKYEIGKTVEVKDADCDETRQCGAGVNLATLPWCMREWSEGMRILLAEFTAKDIAALPNGDGKFRVFRCRIVRELDLAEIGLTTNEKG